MDIRARAAVEVIPVAPVEPLRVAGGHIVVLVRQSGITIAVAAALHVHLLVNGAQTPVSRTGAMVRAATCMFVPWPYQLVLVAERNK
jgi:hypothetical protein